MDRHSLEDLIANASFVRWIRNEAPPGEEAFWNKWLRDDPRHKHFVEEAKNLLTVFQKEDDEISGIQRELEKLESRLDRESVKTYKASGPSRKLKKNKTLYHRRRILTAAIIILAALTSWLTVFQYPLIQDTSGEEARNEYANIQEYRTDFGEKATFRLSDNSRIVLNANSEIRFFSGIDEGQSITEVWLKGEAWFDITHFEDERQRTFTVHTGDGSVEVLGTRFAVKTLGNETRTVLEEGEIRVQVTRQPRQLPGQAGDTILQPGEMALYSTDRGEIAVEKVNPRIYTSWSEDIWFFEDTALKEIAQRIEDTFGIEVHIGEEFAGRKLSGSIKSTDVDVLAEALSKILDTSVEQRSGILYIGRLSREPEGRREL